MEVVRRCGDSRPILGVCLGHQSIGQETGGRIVRARRIMHGKTDWIHHDGSGLFQGIASPMLATRYHSLVIEPETLSPEFRVNAWTHDPDGNLEIMAIQHRSSPTCGVQFHPESFLTEHGPSLLLNFLSMAKT
jgi:anthranilate synthase component 2